MKKLPKSKDPLGFTGEEIHGICKKSGVPLEDFWEAFGINTVCVRPDGKRLYYKCDVERALWKLNRPQGKYHEFD